MVQTQHTNRVKMPKKKNKKKDRVLKSKLRRVEEAVNIRKNLASHGFLTSFKSVEKLCKALSRFVDTGVSETLTVTVEEGGNVRLKMICTNRSDRQSGIEVLYD